jgi:ATP-dependent RNA helicase DDX42
MGWFDEDDDDDEDEEEGKKAPPSASGRGRDADGSVKGGVEGGRDDYDDEDPLDAFMKNLSRGEEELKSHAGGPVPRALESGSGEKSGRISVQERDHRGHRMDLEDEDDGESEGGDDGTDRDESAKATTARTTTTTKAKGSNEAFEFAKESASTTNANGILFHKAHTPDDVSMPSSNHPRRIRRLWEANDTAQGRDWRHQLDVTCSKAIDPMQHWAELTKSEESTSTSAFKDMVRHLQATIPQPTPVQQQTIPVLLSGHNAVITAATGQGKTLAYLIPALMKAVAHGGDRSAANDNQTGHGSNGFLTVVLVPTRELALQVEKAARPLLKLTGIRCKSVIGGKESNYDVVRDLKRQNYGLVVASPGRLADVTKKVPLNPSVVVLDECDKLLQMGFEEQVRQLLSSRFVQAGESSELSPSTTSHRQMVLLSATLGKNVQTVAREWLGPHSVRIAVGRTGQSSVFVTQHVLVLANEQARTDFCVQMVPTFAQVGRTLIFVATRTDCESLAGLLEQQAGVVAVTLHGDKHQWDRTSALKDFTSGKVSVLVATDLASRGLDIPEVATVLCVHPAKNLDVHTHRVGRAGRLDHNEQRQGSAYTLLTPRDSHFARILKSAWEREGRPVGAELDQLASGSTKRSREGWTANATKPDPGQSSYSGAVTCGHSAPGPGDMPPPLEKKNRWGGRMG